MQGKSCILRQEIEKFKILSMIFEILTIFPELINGYLDCSMMKRAAESEAVSFHIKNIRDFATDKHHMTDDSPFGGGPGMVMKPEPVAGAIEKALDDHANLNLPVVYLSPQGKTWNQEMVREFSTLPGLVLLCGRYEGLDERIIDKYVDHEISVGDYVLTGGELGALIMIDSIARLLPGVLGNRASAQQDSFSDDMLLDHPHYTRPEIWDGMAVPEILRSGHHGKVDQWRREQALLRTRERRPDLFEKAQPGLTRKDLKFLATLEKNDK